MSELDYLPLMKLEALEVETAVEKLEYIFSERYTLRKKIKGFLLKKRSEAEKFAELVLEEVDSCGS
jgi:hypothetical protein